MESEIDKANEKSRLPEDANEKDKSKKTIFYMESIPSPQIVYSIIKNCADARWKAWMKGMQI